MNRPTLILIMGPSGVGKGALLTELKKNYPHIHFAKSATTRLQRPGEHKDQYHFFTEQQFNQLINNGKMLEWGRTHGGSNYGTMVDEIIPHLDSDKTVVSEIDINGYETLKKNILFKGKNAKYRLHSIFIQPESIDQLIKHIVKRAPMSDAQVTRRMESAQKEIAYAPKCDTIIINREEKLVETVEKIVRVIVTFL